MSRGATVSILGLYNHDATIFDLMQFPTNFNDYQKETVIYNILAETAELEILYPNPDVMKNMIGIWSRKERPYWDRVYQASLLEYNPIENYRRNETETIEDGKTEQHTGNDITSQGGSDALSKTGTVTAADTGSNSLTKTGTDTSTDSGTESLRRTGTETTNTTAEVNSEDGGNDRVDNNITGFDSNLLVPHDETETYYGKSNETTSEGESTLTLNTTDSQTFGKINTLQHNTTDTETFGKSTTETFNTTDTETFGKTETLQHGEKIEHEGNTERSMLAYGNIGVTTSQEMLTQELEVAKIINVVPIIIESFINRFCLMVY